MKNYKEFINENKAIWPATPIGEVFVGGLDVRFKYVYVGPFGNNILWIIIREWNDKRVFMSEVGEFDLEVSDMNIMIEDYLEKNPEYIINVIKCLKDGLYKYGDKIKGILDRLESNTEIKKYIDLGQLGII